MIDEMLSFLDVWRMYVFVFIIYIVSYRFMSKKPRTYFKTGILLLILGSLLVFASIMLSKILFLSFLYDPAPVLNGNIWMERGRDMTLVITDGTKFGRISYVAFGIFWLFIASFITVMTISGLKKIIPKILPKLAPGYYADAIKIHKEELKVLKEINWENIKRSFKNRNKN